MNTSNHRFVFKANMNYPKVLMVFLAACLVLSGCKKEDRESADTGAKIVSPNNGVALSIEDQQLLVAYRGVAKSYNVKISVNGVTCAAIDGYGALLANPNNPANPMCKLTHMFNYGNAYAPLSDIASILVLGDNTVTVENTSDGYKKDLHFYFNDQKPRVEVTCSDAAGSPQTCGAGDEIRGKIISKAALINTLKFDVANNATSMQMGCVDEGDTGSLSSFTPYNSFISEALPFDCAQGKTKAFVASGISTWPAVANVPAYSYSVTDEYKQTGEAQYILPGAELSDSQAIQLNNTLFQHVRPLVNAYLERINEFIKLQQAGTDVTQSLISGLNTKIQQAIISQQSNDPFWQFASQLCGAAGISSAANCGVTITQLSIADPKLSIGGRGESQYYLRAALDVGRFVLRVEVADLSNPTGRFLKGTLSMDDFSFYTDLSPNVLPAGTHSTIGISRTPIKFAVGKGWFNIPEIELSNVSCAPASLCSGKVLFFKIDATAGLNLYKVFNSDGLESKLAVLGTAVEGFINTAIGQGPYNLTPAGNTDTLRVVNAYSRQAHLQPDMFSKSWRNLLLRFNGGYQASSPVLNTFLGVLYSKPSGSSLVSSGFDDHWPSDPDYYLDIGYALSEGAVNQKLLAEYQSGQWTNNSRHFELDDNGTTKCLVINANTAPFVQFYAYEHQKVSVGGSIGGQYTDENGQTQTDQLAGFDTTKADLPGSAKFSLENANASVYAGDCSNLTTPPLIDNANVSISVRLSLYASGDQARIVPFEGYPDSLGYRKLRNDAPVVVHSLSDDNAENAAKIAHLVNLEVEKVFDPTTGTFNQKQAVPLHIEDISWGADQKNEQVCDLFPQIPGDVCSDLSSVGADTIGGALNFLTTNISGNLFVQYGVNVKQFSIDSTGGYLNILATIKSQSSCDPSAQYFRSYCIQW